MHGEQGLVGGLRGAVEGYGDGGVVVFQADELVAPKFPIP